ncbi:MAG: hypothetical protein JWR11_33 [Mycobacterium sp.]|jgi:hypothetical protein|nr:hypothetical protein [Mycobacterium sp.]MDT5066307.1 hypothetical protein [Mycobacterium sp.]
MLARPNSLEAVEITLGYRGSSAATDFDGLGCAGAYCDICMGGVSLLDDVCTVLPALRARVAQVA